MSAGRPRTRALPGFVALALLALGAAGVHAARIAALEVEGNATVTTQTVLDVVNGLLRVGQEVADLDAAMAAAREALVRRGYFEEVHVAAEGAEGGKLVRITVRERPVVTAIDFVGNTLLTDEKLLETIRTAPGRVVNPYVVEGDGSRIEAAYSKMGAFATVTHADASADGLVTFVIKEARLERIEFSGLQVLTYDEVFATAGLHVGALFSEADVLAARGALTETGWFDRVVLQPRPGEKDGADVILAFAVAERPGLLPERVGRPKPDVSPERLRAAVPPLDVEVPTGLPWLVSPVVIDLDPHVPAALEQLTAQAATASAQGASSLDALAMRAYADALAAVGREREAARWYDDAASLCRALQEAGVADDTVPGILGRSLAATGRLTDALDVLEAAIQAAPDRWEGHADLADVVVAAMTHGAGELGPRRAANGADGAVRPSASAVAQLLPLDATRKALCASLPEPPAGDPWALLASTARERAQAAVDLAPGAPAVARLQVRMAVAPLLVALRGQRLPDEVLDALTHDAGELAERLAQQAQRDPYVACGLLLLRNPRVLAMAAQPSAPLGALDWPELEGFGHELSALCDRWLGAMRGYGATLGWCRLASEPGAAEQDFERVLAQNPYDRAAYHGLLRIAQEAITNAIRHAHATHIDVGLEYGASSVTLTVHDDGCGFNPANAMAGDLGHFGLRGIRARATKIDGVLQVTSTQESPGTTIKIVVPTP